MSKNKQNPYESPNIPSQSGKPSVGRTIFAIALGMLSIPATGIAFFATCAGTYNLNSREPQILPWILGALAGLAVGVPMLYFIIRLMRRTVG